MRRSVLAIVILIVGVILTAGCIGADNPESHNDNITVAVSIVPVETFVKAVAGDTVDVVVMIPPGSSPENYEPTARKMQEFTNSDIFFGIGVPSEKRILSSIGEKTEYLPLETVVSAVYPDRNIGSERDPHIWLSPKRAIVMVQAIADKLSELKPENRELYQKNAQEYIEKLNDLDAKIIQILSDVKGKTFIVEHPAFGYFADDYGLNMAVLEEDGKEATINHRIELEDLAKTKGITKIFYQAESGGSQVAQFAEAIGGEAVALSPLSGEYITNLLEMATLIAGVAR